MEIGSEPKKAKVIPTLTIKETNAATELIASSLTGGSFRFIHSPTTSPKGPKTATNNNALIGLIRIEITAPETAKVIMLQRKPLRIPHNMIGKHQIKLTNIPKTGTYVLIKAKTIAIAARIPASTIAEVLCATKFPPQKTY